MKLITTAVISMIVIAAWGCASSKKSRQRSAPKSMFGYPYSNQESQVRKAFGG